MKLDRSDNPKTIVHSFKPDKVWTEYEPYWLTEGKNFFKGEQLHSVTINLFFPSQSALELLATPTQGYFLLKHMTFSELSSRIQ